MLKTFSLGGIHPEENKLTADRAIEVLPVPPVVMVPVTQHIGAPAKVEVKKGDKVKVGQVIARAGGMVSANVHSPVSGTVNKIDDIVDASGYRRTAVIIDTEGDEWEDGIDRSTTIKKEITASPEEIVTGIAEAGIVGLGELPSPHM